MNGSRHPSGEPPGVPHPDGTAASQEMVRLEIPRAVLVRLLRERSLFVTEMRCLSQRSRIVAREALKAALMHVAV